MNVKKSTRHPVKFDFSKVQAVDKLRVNRNGKDKALAKQLKELITYIKDCKITVISREDYYKKINLINSVDTDKKQRATFKEKYPQLEKSVQTIQAVSNFYWVRGDMKEIGVRGITTVEA